MLNANFDGPVLLLQMVRRLSLAELEKKAIEAATQASLLSHKMEAAGRQSPVHTSNQVRPPVPVALQK